MSNEKQVIGGPLVIGGLTLSLSRAIRAGDFVFLTGQLPMRDGVPMTTCTVEDLTRATHEDIEPQLAQPRGVLSYLVHAVVLLRDSRDVACFNSVYGEYFPDRPPTRSAVVSDLLVDVRVEVEVVAYRPLNGEA